MPVTIYAPKPAVVVVDSALVVSIKAFVKATTVDIVFSAVGTPCVNASAWLSYNLTSISLGPNELLKKPRWTSSAFGVIASPVFLSTASAFNDLGFFRPADSKSEIIYLEPSFAILDVTIPLSFLLEFSSTLFSLQPKIVSIVIKIINFFVLTLKIV